MSNRSQSLSLLRPSIIYFLSASFFVYEFFLQVSPSVMTHDLMRDLHVDAAGLGLLSAFYYYAYTPMQLPAGLLYDRFGPRILLSFATFICALGAIFFGMAPGIVAASAGRFFMGIGSAFAFTGTLLLATRWFPSHFFAPLAGVLQMLSCVGTLVGTVPLAKAVDTFGWRPTVLAIAILGFFIMISIALVVRDGPKDHYETHKIDAHNEWVRLKRACCNKQAWWVAIFSFTSWAPILVFAALWGVPFLMARFGVTNTQAASANAMIWCGVAIGSPLVGFISEKMKRRNPALSMCSLVGLISILLILYVPQIPFWVVFPLLFFFGLAAGSQTLTFAVVKDNNNPSIVGTAMGFNNMMVVAGGALLQPLVGYILHLCWTGQMALGVPVYTLTNYRYALIIIPICSLAGLIISSRFIKETFCEPVYKM